MNVRTIVAVACLLAAPALSRLRAAPATKLYWAQTDPHAVRRANLDGTTVEPVVSTPDVADAVGVSFDGLAGKVYWAEAQPLGDRIVQANPDGTALDPVVLYDDVVSPGDVAVDPVSGKLCWAEDHPTDSSDRIACAGLDGSNPQTIIAWPVLLNPAGLAIDPLGAKLYWVQRVTTNDAVMRANLDGSGSQSIVNWPTVADPTAVAVDPLGGKVYWAQASPNDDRIMRADLGGANPQTILSSPLVISPVALAVDPIGAKVYWAEDQSFDDRIRRANLDGTGEQTILTFVDVGDPVGLALDGTLADQPPALLADPTSITKNRFVSMQVVGGATVQSAIRLTLVALPAPFNTWNGAELWVAGAGTACEVAAVGPGQPCPPGAPAFTAAKLRCTAECRSDWSRLGTIHVSHEGIIPGATYRAEIADCATDLNDPANFLTPLDLSTPRWGDAVGAFVAGSWTGPNGAVEIVTDVVADLDKFGNRTAAPIKARADLEPACIDGKINITDAIRMLDAFRGLAYPFVPSAADPCASLCP